jgi:5-methylcytosine-specific restriction endonuclease McrA
LSPDVVEMTKRIHPLILRISTLFILALACDFVQDVATPADVQPVDDTTTSSLSTDEVGDVEMDVLAGITIREPSHEDTYDRDDWPHWRDADHDCQDARDEVLIAESLVPVEFFSDLKCDVTRGKWICPYTGRTFTGSGDLDIDHVVPLKNAHVSGAWAWTRERREEFANELADPAHLVAVEARANRSKGDRGPEDWLPAESVCEYVSSWIAIKRRWALSMSEREAAAVRRVAAECR